MARVNPQEFAENWYRGVSANTDKVVKGINRVTVAPGERAAAMQAKMLNNLTAAVQSGKWANNTRAVTLEQWRTAAIDKGVPRIANGALKAQPRMAEVGQKLLPFLDAVVAKIKTMPKNTIQDSANRAAAFVIEMGKYKG